MMRRRGEAGYKFVAFGETFQLVSVGIIAAASEAMRGIVRIKILDRRRVRCTHRTSRLMIDWGGRVDGRRSRSCFRRCDTTFRLRQPPIHPLFIGHGGAPLKETLGVRSDGMSQLLHTAFDNFQNFLPDYYRRR